MATMAEETEPRRWRLPEALPALGPAAMRVYVALWSLMLAGTIVLNALGAYADFQNRINPTWTSYGLGVAVIDGQLVVTAVAGSKAVAAGVSTGDRVVALNGRRMPRFEGFQETRDWAIGPEGRATRFTFAREGNPPRDVVLIRESRNTELRMQGTGFSVFSLGVYLIFWSIITALLLIAAATLLFRQRRQPVAALLSIAYLALAGADGLGNVGAGYLGIQGEIAPLISFGWGGMLLALVALPDGRFVPRWTVWVAAFLVIFWTIDALILTDTASLIGGSAAMLATIVTIALRYRRLPAGPQRQQMRWAFLGFAWGLALIVLGVLSQTIADVPAANDPRWDIWGVVIAMPLFSIGLWAGAGGLMISMLRYRLYDADAVISRSAGYAVMTLLIAGIFGASAKAIEWLFEANLGRDAGALPGAIGAGLAVVLITPMHNRIHRWAERRFQKDLIALKRDLPDCVGDLRETATLQELLDEVLRRVESGVRAVRAAIVIEGKTVAAHGDGAEFPIRVPLRIGHQDLEIGTLLVGPRPDGSAPGKDEREALNEVADPIARAIRIVGKREAEKQQLERRFAKLEAALPRRARRSATAS